MAHKLLQILHLCYDMQATLHQKALDRSKTLPKVRFWTEQLKIAIMTRYGKLGTDLETVRSAMQHTKLVLRHRDGMERAQYAFI